MSGLTVSSSYHHPLVTQPPLVETKKYFCPFLERGYCREASRCNFSHDNRGSTKIPTDYCHFYLANQCLYGQDCKFRHTEPVVSCSPQTQTTTTATPQSVSPRNSPMRFDADHFQTVIAVAAASPLNSKQQRQLSSSLTSPSSSTPPVSGSSKAILSSSSSSTSCGGGGGSGSSSSYLVVVGRRASRQAGR